jgi:HEAT repeat protein
LDLDNWIARFRSPDPMRFEDAYWGERPSGPGVIRRLVAEMHRSPDGYTRGKFVELLGEMGDASVIPVLIAELSLTEPDVRFWAAAALEQLGVPDGTSGSGEV